MDGRAAEEAALIRIIFSDEPVSFQEAGFFVVSKIKNI
jgi:hypothetical protein